ncbi:MAG TPA: PH domain-containing protein [Anaerolineales bacterium]
MENASDFHPDRWLGLVFHIAVILALIAIGVWGVFQMTRTDVSPIFFLYLIAVLLSLGLVPVAVYRAYTLYRAVYVIRRDGIQLRWGLRAEDIPINLVQWVGQLGDFDLPLPIPRLRWPGSVVGVQNLSDGRKVEFMAAGASQLVLISTSQHVYVISPHDPQAFLDAYQHLTELGSADPIPARSVYPSLFLAQVWHTKPARYLIIAGSIFSLILLIWVSFIIPVRPTIPFGFQLEGIPGDQVPSRQLLLFPIASGVFFLADMLLGMFFFRRSLNPEVRQASELHADRITAYLLWACGALTPLLFIAAVFFILRV